MTDAASETARPIVLWQTISKERLDNLECSSLRELGIYGEAQDTWSINLTQLVRARVCREGFSSFFSLPVSARRFPSGLSAHRLWPSGGLRAAINFLPWKFL